MHAFAITARPPQRRAADGKDLIAHGIFFLFKNSRGRILRALPARSSRSIHGRDLAWVKYPQPADDYLIKHN
jgi:hypothetical protein